MVRQAGFFDLEERLTLLAAKGDGLERLSAVVDFELFRPELERAVPRADRSKGGRPPFDHVLMFKGAGPADPEQSESLPELSWLEHALEAHAGHEQRSEDGHVP